MTINPLENIKAQLTPETDLSGGLASPAAEMAPNGKTPTAWEQRSKDSGRPPWGWLLLGIVALSLVYWWGGRETGVTLLRVSTPPQMSVLARDDM